MRLPPSLETKLLSFSVSPSGGDVSPDADETVILVFAPERVPGAFARAKALLDGGARRVRVVGPGVTLERSWPTWVAGQERFVVTEHGAFNHAPFAVSTRELDRRLRQWLDRVFEGAFAGRPSDVLYTSACARFLQTSITTYPVARALADAFPRGRFVCMEGGFHTINGGFDPLLFETLVTNVGGSIEWAGEHPRTGSTARWVAKMSTLGPAALAGALVEQVKEYVRGAPSRREIRRRRTVADPIDLWLTVVPDWARANVIAVEAFARPMLEDGKRLGLLFVATLRPGERDESDMKRNRPSPDLWPGLARLRADLGRCAIEQGVMPDRPATFVRTLWRGTVASARALAKLTPAPEIPLDDMTIDLRRHAWPLLALATLDVLRGVLAEEASRDVTARHDMRGKVVIASGSSTVSNAAVDLELQRSGATTVNSPDGSGSDVWTGVGSTVSTARSAWTYSDARSIGDTCRHVIVAGMPPRAPHPRPHGPRRHVLILNGHGHREYFVNGVFRERLFQEELLDVVRELRKLGAPELRFRWRPHPAATQASIDAGMAQLEDVALSRGVPLDEDAAWADLVVCGYSTTVIELISAGLPVFVQVRPEMVGLPALDFVAPERTFFRANEGARKIAACIEAFDRGASDVFAPETAARIALFGPTGSPLPPLAAFEGARALAHFGGSSSAPPIVRHGDEERLPS